MLDQHEILQIGKTLDSLKRAHEIAEQNRLFAEAMEKDRVGKVGGNDKCDKDMEVDIRYDKCNSEQNDKDIDKGNDRGNDRRNDRGSDKLKNKKIVIPKLKYKLLPKFIFTLKFSLPNNKIITVQTSYKEKIINLVQYTLFTNNLDYDCDLYLNGNIIDNVAIISSLVNRSLYHISY
jgi:hypothetical protein